MLSEIIQTPEIVNNYKLKVKEDLSNLSMYLTEVLHCNVRRTLKIKAVFIAF